MNITLSGSLGHINTHLIKALVQQGHQLKVISSNSARQSDIEVLSATAAIGSLEDTDFLTQSFAGAELVYCMIPPNDYFDQELDLLAYYEQIANNFVTAIETTGIQQVIYLSSIGAHMATGNGLLQGHYNGEQIMQQLPSTVNIKTLRPTEFYYNLYGQIPSIKEHGVMASVCGEEVVNAWISPKDIAQTIAEEIKKGISGRTVRYITGEEITYKELATTLGKAIGRPDLKWVQITPEAMTQGLVQAGLNPKIAAGLVEMYGAINNGSLYEHYRLQRPASFGTVKVKDFAHNFAAAYRS